MKKFIQTIILALGLSAMLSAQIYEFSENGVKKKYRLSMEQMQLKSTQKAAPVFYDVNEEPASAKAKDPRAQARRVAARRIMTAKLMVKGAAPASEKAAKQANSLLPGWEILTYADAWEALRATQRLTAAGVEFAPVWAKQQAKRQAPAFSGTRAREVNDPLFQQQWHLADSPTGVNLRAAWDFATGRGINMTIVDDGLQIDHEDLKDNSYPLDSGLHVNFNEGDEDDPSPLTAEDAHGTSCAGLAAGRGFNGLGVVGVAPEAKMIGLRLIAGPADDEAESIAFAYEPKDMVVHVSSNSWGPADDGKTLGQPGPLALAGLEVAATKNRGGLGTVLVISAGNGRDNGDDSGWDAYSSSRFAISVGAVNRKGEQSSYSESGMAVAVSAFGGEQKPPEMVWTTNLMGDEPLGLLRESQPTSVAPKNYTDAFNGTSAAAPQVSGAAALMLQRNPRLTARDVKEILIRTARRDGLVGGDAFVANGAGIQFSHSFGAGLLNVAGALEMAETWRNLPAQTSVGGEAPGFPRGIPDNDPQGVTVEFANAGAENRLRVESVEVTVDIQHAHRGDLSLVITSPSGMRSVAQARPADDGQNIEKFTFTSVRHWGETSTGTWRVQVIDTAREDTGLIRGMSMRLYGTAQ